MDFVAGGAVSALYDLGGGVSLCNGRDTSHVLQDAQAPERVEAELAVPGETKWSGWCFQARLLEGAPGAPLAEYCTPRRQVFDADAAGNPLLVRARREGDRFRPLGMDGEKKLKDYFNDAGVPGPLRGACALLCAGPRVLWVVGHAPSRDAAVRPETTRFLEVEVTRCD